MSISSKTMGRRRISETINRILIKELFASSESMFGVDPWLTTEDLRDEEEPSKTRRDCDLGV